MYKNLFLLFVTAILFASCSTYRSSQTPDDVYYSPSNNQDDADHYITPDENNYLRMKVQNNSRWSTLDDFDYWYDSRYYGNHFYAFNNPYSFNSPFSYWGFGFYSPFSFWNTFSYSPWGFNPWGYNPWGFYSPYTTIVYYKNRRLYSGNVFNANMNGYNNMYYNNENYNLTNGQKTDKKSFGSLFKSNFSSREQNSNYTPQNGSRTQPVRVFQPAPRVNNINEGSRSGGFKSSGNNNMGSRPPKNN
ncbi:MAG: hypothetical protein JSS67_10440 [Bacteroidetes bacterium]|nr:hypothetical protein [Bacteroidota bacterium]